MDVPPDSMDLFVSCIDQHKKYRARTRSSKDNIQRRSLTMAPANSDGHAEKYFPQGVVEETWPEPKKEFYFTPHVRSTPADQGNRCFGCGTELSESLFARVPYCEYYGKYFCLKCHTNDSSIIPARILSQWDFKLYPVSIYAHKFIRETRKEPVYDLSVIHPQLYKMVPELRKIKMLRKQLYYMKDFILSCSNVRELPKYTNLIHSRQHIFYDTDFYSLVDFQEVTNSKLLQFLRNSSEAFIKHIMGCQLCLLKGSICEFCEDKKPIYSFHIVSTAQCPGCKGFFHRDCFLKNPNKCPRCFRIVSRRYNKT